MGAGQSYLPAKQSVDAPVAAKPGEGVPKRLNAQAPPTGGKFGADDLYSSFARTASALPDNNCFGYRPVVNGKDELGPFEFESYKTIHDRVLSIGSGIAGLGLGKGTNFGMYAANSSMFQCVVLGCFSQGLTAVPIYDTLGDDIVRYEVNHAELKIMFVEAKKLSEVQKVLKDCKTLKYVVQLTPLEGSVSEETVSEFEKAGVSLIDVQQLMKATPVKPNPASGSDLAFIMYTSGTTGDPKGVCITQLSITIGASWCAGLELYPTDRYLSYLPLAHIFETMVEHGLLAYGGSIGFYGGNIKKVQEDILALKPTVFAGVPRVYQRFYDAAYSKINAHKLKGLLLFMMTQELEARKTGGKTIWGKLLAKLLGAKITGGSVRLMISGAAPLPLHVQEFLLAGIGCDVIQGYGMTENCANATLALKQDWRPGHVGPPMPTMEIKLVDVPEMNYTTAGNNCGEVCTKGGCNFAGYHKNKEETDKVLDADGWLHTGDIGRWNADGTLSIIDRKKNIFKLSQGEYIAAEKIEMAISKNRFIGQPWVYGNSFFPMLVAVITPDFAELTKYATEHGWGVTDPAALAKDDRAIKLIFDEMVKEAKAAKLKTFEIPQKLFLEGQINELAQGFSMENDCLTPTFKLKRPQLLKRYQEKIDEMYVSLGEDPSKFKRI